MVLAASSSDCRGRSRPRHEVEKFDLTHSRQKSPTNRCRYGGDTTIEDVKRCSRDGRQVEDTSLQSGVAPVGGTLGNSQFDCGSREHVQPLYEVAYMGSDLFSRRRLCQSSSVACHDKQDRLRATVNWSRPCLLQMHSKKRGRVVHSTKSAEGLAGVRKLQHLLNWTGSVVTMRFFFDRVLPFRGERGKGKRRKIPNVFFDTWSNSTRPF